MAQTEELVLNTQPTTFEKASTGWYAYVMVDRPEDKDGFKWMSLMDAGIQRDKNFNPSSCIGCKFPTDWKQRQILLISPDLKSFYIADGFEGKRTKLDPETVKKNGLVPLGFEGSKGGSLETSGSGGKGEGGAAPFGFKLPLFNVDVWDKVPSALLWLGVANGVYQVDKKVRRKQPLKLVGTAGIIGGIYSGYELARRKKNKDKK